MMGCISYNLFCQMCGFQGATWSLKTGHQVTHLAIERELVEAIRIGHLSIGDSKILRPLWRSVWQLQGSRLLFGRVERYWGVFVREERAFTGGQVRGERRDKLREGEISGEASG